MIAKEMTMRLLLTAILTTCVMVSACSIVKLGPPKPGCTCKTACCYIEATSVAVGGCFEYTGPSGLVKQFKSSCSGKESAPTVYAIGVPRDGDCTVGPTTGVPCVPGLTVNSVKIPDDSSCHCP